MPANLRSADDANIQALVESYLNIHPKATRAEAIAAVPGAKEVYEYLDTPDKPTAELSEFKEYDETPGKDWFYADPKKDDVTAQVAGTSEAAENEEATLVAVEDEDDFDPYEATAKKVVEFVQSHPDQADEVLEAERQGKNRKTVFTNLNN